MGQSNDRQRPQLKRLQRRSRLLRRVIALIPRGERDAVYAEAVNHKAGEDEDEDENDVGRRIDGSISFGGNGLRDVEWPGHLYLATTGLVSPRRGPAGQAEKGKIARRRSVNSRRRAT